MSVESPGAVRAVDPRRRSLVRKITYVAAMCALLMPLFWLNHPATRDTKSGQGRPGGKLAQLRDKHKLSPTQLGEVDLTSETIKLGTLGMRGVAVQLLWAKANNFQMKKDWNNLRATLEQISKLQPHFIGVWRHQAWNISYNVSASFDDYHDKFYWVLDGIKFLQQGIRHNEREPRLPWDLAWFISHKIGRADEAKLFRALFRQETYFQTEGQGLPLLIDPELAATLDRQDNWHVGKAWFREAERVSAAWSAHVQGMSDLIFYSDAPLAQMYYADNLEKDGRFDEVAKRAWMTAAKDWHQFGERELPVSEGVTVRLNDLPKYETEAAEAKAVLEELSPGLREKIREEKRARLKPAERAALDTPLEKRTPEQQGVVNEVEPRVQVTYEEVARRITGPQRRKALDLAAKASHAEEMARLIRRERSKVNFEYWELRARAEQTPEAFEARKTIYEGDRAFAHAEIVPARAAYEKGLQAWRKVLDKYPALKEDITLGGDLVDVIRRYRRALDQLEGQFPQPFILQDILDRHEKKR